MLSRFGARDLPPAEEEEVEEEVREYIRASSQIQKRPIKSRDSFFSVLNRG